MKTLTFIPTDKKRLSSNVNTLKAALDALNVLLESAKQMERKASALAEEIDKLESSIDPMDDSAVGLLTTKQKQAELLARKISANERAIETAEREVIEAAAAVPDLICELLQPAYQEYIAEIADVLLPYCENRARAITIAQGMDAVQSFRGFLAAYWSESRTVGTAQLALRYLQELSEGKCPWGPYKPR